MIRRPPRSTQSRSSAASDVYKRQYQRRVHGEKFEREEMEPARATNGAPTGSLDRTPELWRAFETPLGVCQSAQAGQTREKDEQLRHLMHNVYNQYLSDQEYNARKVALDDLEAILREWMRDVLKRSNLIHESLLEDYVPFRFYAYGSYKLKLSSPGGDIDTLILAPSRRYVTRERDFFEDLYQRLLREPKVTDLKRVVKARVPLIKMYYDGIQIDMAFANLEFIDIIDRDFDSAEEHSLANNKYLIGMVETDDRERKKTASLASVDGLRVASRVKSLISNEETFILLTKTIKLWAKKRGIYSNMLGYLSGILIAFLVVKVMQMFPTLSPFRLLWHFFFIFSQERGWKTPINIDDPEKGRDGLPENLLEMERSNKREAENDIVKVFTPAFPSYNSAKRISNYTRKVILTQMKWGYEQLRAARDPAVPFNWEEFFEELPFFSEYEHFLEVSILGGGDKGEFAEWRGLVESNLSYLLQKYFEKHHEMEKYFDYMHLYPESFDRPAVSLSAGGPGDMDIEYKLNTCYYLGIRLTKDCEKERQVNIRPFRDDVHMFSQNLRNKFLQERKNPIINLTVKYMRASQIPIDIRQRKGSTTSDYNGDHSAQTMQMHLNRERQTVVRQAPQMPPPQIPQAKMAPPQIPIPQVQPSRAPLPQVPPQIPVQMQTRVLNNFSRPLNVQPTPPPPPPINPVVGKAVEVADGNDYGETFSIGVLLGVDPTSTQTQRPPIPIMEPPLRKQVKEDN
eukprot:TRINITY_DN4255_c0_g3_i1.p1 TRINITY_DN4255_c0_g3~~TRINITY_DN4255_c0_g3_i1.p1  ORF type:complete len:740 (+),score=162.88 TRINITY_DN4255_c0_g3_i1:49-2268(+)